MGKASACLTSSTMVTITGRLIYFNWRKLQ
jgi:hypothetical protein